MSRRPSDVNELPVARVGLTGCEPRSTPDGTGIIKKPVKGTVEKIVINTATGKMRVYGTDDGDLAVCMLCADNNTCDGEVMKPCRIPCG